MTVVPVKPTRRGAVGSRGRVRGNHRLHHAARCCRSIGVVLLFDVESVIGLVVMMMNKKNKKKDDDEDDDA